MKEKGRFITVLLQGILLTGIITFLCLLLLAYLMLKLQPDDQKIELFILFVYIAACFCGGWYCGKKMKYRKYLWGLMTGSTYFILLLTATLLTSQGVTSGLLHGSAAFVLCSAGGMAGGILA